ncbi:MAG: penicillin-binding protein activator LpoB [Spirochaetaceae bacterium]|jgi:uncharacterized protein (TIGR02722 family)|nr:penicillin-binding protein activator LpoB [Spirochaetaceae bacterium]
MKKLVIVVCACAVFTGACSSTPKVQRVDAKTQIDLSGNWNDSDVRIVCKSLIDNCLQSPRMTQALARRRGKTPNVLVGEFENQSSEHINTDIITSIMETTIFDSGKLDFVAGGKQRDAMRRERVDQMNNASEATAKAIGNETGADFMLTGSVKAIVDREGQTTVRTYFVDAQMTDLETGQRVWMAQNSDIKKVVTRPRNKL